MPTLRVRTIHSEIAAKPVVLNVLVFLLGLKILMQWAVLQPRKRLQEWSGTLIKQRSAAEAPHVQHRRAGIVGFGHETVQVERIVCKIRRNLNAARVRGRLSEVRVAAQGAVVEVRVRGCDIARVRDTSGEVRVRSEGHDGARNTLVGARARDMGHGTRVAALNTLVETLGA